MVNFQFKFHEEHNRQVKVTNSIIKMVKLKSFFNSFFVVLFMLIM